MKTFLVIIVSCLIATIGVVSSAPENSSIDRTRQELSGPNGGITNAVHKTFPQSGEYEPRDTTMDAWCCGQ
jgi:hypothetical protein